MGPKKKKRLEDNALGTLALQSKTASEASLDSEGNVRVDGGFDPITNTYVKVMVDPSKGPQSPTGVKLFERAFDNFASPSNLDSKDVAKAMGVDYNPWLTARGTNGPFLNNYYSGGGLGTREWSVLGGPDKLDRVSAYHEATHKSDPALDRLPSTPTFEHEAPAMVAENAEALREGWVPKDNDWRYEAIKKYGPQFKGDLPKDVAEVDRFAKEIRGDTPTGRGYKAFIADKTKDAGREADEASIGRDRKYHEEREPVLGQRVKDLVPVLAIGGAIGALGYLLYKKYKKSETPQELPILA